MWSASAFHLLANQRFQRIWVNIWYWSCCEDAFLCGIENKTKKLNLELNVNNDFHFVLTRNDFRYLSTKCTAWMKFFTRKHNLIKVIALNAVFQMNDLHKWVFCFQICCAIILSRVIRGRNSDWQKNDKSQITCQFWITKNMSVYSVWSYWRIIECLLAIAWFCETNHLHIPANEQRKEASGEC